MELLLANLPWMTWNLMLAAVPAALSVPLFTIGRRMTAPWWLGATVFVAFLPNAPYVLTDVIHLIREVRYTDDPILIAVLGLQFALFFLAGFSCYVLALVRLQRWMDARHWARATRLTVETGLHALCAVGIFLGRVFRFNSWDVVTAPDLITGVLRVPQPATVALLAFTFIVLVTATVVLKVMHRAVAG